MIQFKLFLLSSHELTIFFHFSLSFFSIFFIDFSVYHTTLSRKECPVLSLRSLYFIYIHTHCMMIRSHNVLSATQKYKVLTVLSQYPPVFGIFPLQVIHINC